jgi:hypothetical protein
MVRKLLIVVTVVVALSLGSLFLPARQMGIEGIGRVSFETKVILSVGSEVAYANPATERQSPDAILAITKLTPNDVTYIQDDPDTPDANWLVATANTQETNVRVSFPTPTGNPTVGADLQEFRALVRRYSQTQTGVPQARIELWENGALIRAGADVDVPLGTFIVSFTWNANEIGTANGSLVECKVVGTKATGASGVRNTVDVGAVEWNVDYTLPVISISISYSPSPYPFGTVLENQTYPTATTYFTVTNNGDVTVNIVVYGANTTGGSPCWVLSDDASQGPNTYGLMFCRNANPGVWIVIPRYDEPPNPPDSADYMYGLVVGSSDQFGLQLWTPLTITDKTNEQTSVITFTAAAAVP